MNAWHDFFLAQAAAAGVLTGLVFVGVSINLQKIVSDPRSGLAGRAGEALILAGRRAHGVCLGARAGSGPGCARRGGARGGARHLGVDRGHPAAAAAGVGDHEGRPARPPRVAGGAWPGRHADAGDRGCRRALGWAGRALLAGGWHGFLDPSGFVRGVGVASRDQPLGAGRGFLPPYSPECVEKLFGNSEWVPNGAPKAAKRGRRSPDRPPLAAKEALSRRLQLFSKQFRRDCPKSLVGARDVALWTAAKALFDPFRLPHDIRIHLRNVAQYLFGQSRKGNSTKFALIGFCELRLMRVLRSLLVVGVPSSIKITSST